jgi:hypothetical protein
MAESSALRDEFLEFARVASASPLVDDAVELVSARESGSLRDEYLDYIPQSSSPLRDETLDSAPVFSAGLVFDGVADSVLPWSAGLLADIEATALIINGAGLILDFQLVVIPAPFTPLSPATAELPEPKIPVMNARLCSGTGGDDSPGICGRAS